MKRSGFKQKERKPLKRTVFRVKTPIGASKTPKTRKRKSELKKLKERLWELCREITRKRYGNHCYTCPSNGLEGSNWQTGHFISSSICSVFMRYELTNLRPQCYSCNINKSGNWLAFKDHLRADGIDTDVLEQMNRDTKGKQYDILWYESKVSEYEAIFASP